MVMPVMSLAVVTKGPAATAGSTFIRFNKMGINVAILVETMNAMINDSPTTMPRNA